MRVIIRTEDRRNGINLEQTGWFETIIQVADFDEEIELEFKGFDCDADGVNFCVGLDKQEAQDLIDALNLILKKMKS